MNERTVTTARWLAFLPASVSAAVLVSCPLHFLVILGSTVLPYSVTPVEAFWVVPTNEFERLG